VRQTSKTRILVECALMLALATVLSKIEIPLWMQGGSITLASMLPILIVSFRHGVGWGLLTAFTHSLIQMMMGFHNVLYATTLAAQIGCILLDYVLGYTVLGLAKAFGSRFKSRVAGVAAGSSAVIALRFVFSFISGILLWGGYAPEGTPVWIYSLTYNGGYMLPELIITVAAAVLLAKNAPFDTAAI
jgi:thiamine transporter